MSLTDPHRSEPIPRLLWGIVALCLGLEAVFTLAETGLVGQPGLRRWALAHGAFWAGLLGDWAQVYAGQRFTMFLSYTILHAGLMHVIFNMLVLVHVGREVLDRIGTLGFLLLCAVTAITGACAFALYPSSMGPMVGASGVVFGLLGTVMWWDWQRRSHAGESTSPVLRTGLGLLILNGILWFLTDGTLAWQTHLGGWLGGIAFARLVTPTPHHDAQEPDNRSRRRGFH